MTNNGTQHTIPTEPLDVYNVLAGIIAANKLPMHETAAIAYALGAMEAAFPSAIGGALEQRRFARNYAAIAEVLEG